tara:strand:- start:312 stop:839 length:528 start_codon:yes stop_codon:yes gene_type:complete
MTEPPDPYENRGLILLYPTLLKFDSCHPRHPANNDFMFMYEHCKGGESLETGRVHINSDGIDNQSWDTLMEIINSCYHVTGPTTQLVSIHNLSLIQRAAWWWSRRNTLPDPAWNNNYANIDMVNLYNGPAIITAEERFSFNVHNALKSFTKKAERDNDIGAEFRVFKQLWEFVQA